MIVSPAGGRPIARTRVHHTVVISARRIARIVKSSNGAANSSALLGSDSRADAVLSSDPASPACITFVRETTVGDSNKFTSWGCAPTSTIFTALEGVTGGSGGGGSFPLSSSTSGSLTGMEEEDKFRRRSGSPWADSKQALHRALPQRVRIAPATPIIITTLYRSQPR